MNLISKIQVVIPKVNLCINWILKLHNKNNKIRNKYYHTRIYFETISVTKFYNLKIFYKKVVLILKQNVSKLCKTTQFFNIYELKVHSNP